MTGYEILRSMIGLREGRDRQKLIKFFQDNNVKCDPYTTPWCSAAMMASQRAAGNVIPNYISLMARSWLKLPNKIALDDAEEGDIVIFARGSNGYSGHVTYFVEHNPDDNTIICLGGNQADMVCEAPYRTDRLLGIRRL